MSNSVAGALKQHDKERERLGETTELVEEQVGWLGASDWAWARDEGPAGCWVAVLSPTDCRGLWASCGGASLVSVAPASWQSVHTNHLH